MAAIIKVDGFDLYPFLRVAPDDGFDPADPDFISPQFGDVAGEGAPLISINEDNREFVVPVHFAPYKDVTFANTKDGLHLLVQAWNARLAGAQQLEWRDEGATNSTFLDVVAARFEPAYQFRRAQSKWMSGVVRIWTRPFGTSGTYIIRATAAATGVSVVAAIPSVAGDQNAIVQPNIRTGSAPVPQGRVVGFAVAPSGRWIDVPAASILATGYYSSTITAAANGPGSQCIAIGHAQSVGGQGRLCLSPASMYIGRTRVLGCVQGLFGQIQAVNQNGDLIGQPSLASYGAGWGLVDIGVLTVDPVPGTATVVLDFNSPANTVSGYAFEESDIYNFPGHVRLSRLLLLPEDSTALVIDTNRKLLSQFGVAQLSQGATNFLNDDLGNVLAVPNGNTILQCIGAAGFAPTGAAAGVFKKGGLQVNCPDITDFFGEVGFGLSANASQAVFIGRAFQSNAGAVSPGGIVAQVHRAAAAAGNDVISIVAGSTLLASKAASIGAAALVFRIGMGTMVAEVRDRGTTFQTLTAVGAASSGFVDPGVLLIGVNGTGTSSTITQWRVQEIASAPVNPRDSYEFTPSGVIRRNTASVITGKLSALGQQIITATPGYNQVVAFEQPLTSQEGNHILDVEVRVRERFTYAR